jgi:hypothetical protein
MGLGFVYIKVCRSFGVEGLGLSNLDWHENLDFGTYKGFLWKKLTHIHRFQKQSVNYQISTTDVFCLKNVKITTKNWVYSLHFEVGLQLRLEMVHFFLSFTYLSVLLCFCHATVKKLSPSSLAEVRPKDGGGLTRMRSPTRPPRTPNFSDGPILNSYLLLTKLPCLPLLTDPKP